MKLSRSIAALLLPLLGVVLSAGLPSIACGGEKPEKVRGWDGTVINQPLPAYPIIEVLSRQPKVRLRVTNPGPVSLYYRAGNPSHPKPYWEELKDGAWTCAGTHWCSTGIRSWELKPGESVELIISPTESNHRRVLALFRTGDGKSDLIPLSPPD